MIESFGLESILIFIIIVLMLLAFQLDRFSKRSIQHIDKLQQRVDELEKRLGIK